MLPMAYSVRSVFQAPEDPPAGCNYAPSREKGVEESAAQPAAVVQGVLAGEAHRGSEPSATLSQC
jgi:hypothetical protein